MLCAFSLVFQVEFLVGLFRGERDGGASRQVPGYVVRSVSGQRECRIPGIHDAARVLCNSLRDSSDTKS